MLKDIVFVREESRPRFVVGSAGALYTVNGTEWYRLLSISALPEHPMPAYFDNVSDPFDRGALGWNGRAAVSCAWTRSPTLAADRGMRRPALHEREHVRTLSSLGPN